MLKNLYDEQRVRIGDAELARALKDHERFATGRGGTRAQFKCTDLEGSVLANRNLDEADFTGASLIGANFFGSSLVRASFYCADLRRCNLRSTKLTNADLRGASFKGADLSNSVLDSADLRAAVMMFMSRQKITVLDHSSSPGGVFGGVDFSNCSLRNTSFSNAKLDGANFSGSLLVGANFRGARLTDVSFHGAVLMGVDLAELNVPPAALEGCVIDVAPAAASNAAKLGAMLDEHQRWVESNGKAGAGAVLDGEDLRPLLSSFVKRPLVGISARNTMAIGVDFTECQLQGAKFDGADLRGANFTGADLSGASFKAAKLIHARFDRARFGTLHILDGTTLAPNLEGAQVFAEQFRSAIADSPALFSALATIADTAAAF